MLLATNRYKLSSKVCGWDWDERADRTLKNLDKVGLPEADIRDAIISIRKMQAE